jgi:hypothetical protein
MLGENDSQYWRCGTFLFLSNYAVVPWLGRRDAGATSKPQTKNTRSPVLDAKKYAALGETAVLRTARPALQNLRKGRVSFDSPPDPLCSKRTSSFVLCRNLNRESLLKDRVPIAIPIPIPTASGFLPAQL